MASKKKVSLNDYDLSTTLGTGISLDFNSIFQVLLVVLDWQEIKGLESISP